MNLEEDLMFGRKDLILTATTCALLEKLRVILEVLYGSRIRFKHFHLHDGLQTGRGSVYVDGQELNLTFEELHKDEFCIMTDDERYTARFDSPDTIRVIQYCGNPPIWTVGTAWDDRHGEPLFP